MDEPLPELNDVKDMIGCATMLIGKPKTGKTIVMSKLVSQLYEHMDTIFFFSSSETSAEQYEKEVGLSNTFFFTNSQVTKELMNDICNAQSNRSVIYRNVHKIETLVDILSLKLDDETINTLVDELTELCENDEELIVQELRDTINEDLDSYLETAKERIDELIHSDEEDFLEKATALADIHNLICNFNINPHVLLLFDDVTSISKEFTGQLKVGNRRDGTEEVKRPFLDMLTTGRHKYITILFITHSLNDILRPAIVKAFKYIICTAPDIMEGYRDKIQLPKNVGREVIEHLYEKAKIAIHRTKNKYAVIAYCSNPTDNGIYFYYIAYPDEKYTMPYKKVSPFDSIVASSSKRVRPRF